MKRVLPFPPNNYRAGRQPGWSSKTILKGRQEVSCAQPSQTTTTNSLFTISHQTMMETAQNPEPQNLGNSNCFQDSVCSHHSGKQTLWRCQGTKCSWKCSSPSFEDYKKEINFHCQMIQHHKLITGFTSDNDIQKETTETFHELSSPLEHEFFEIGTILLVYFYCQCLAQELYIQ